jgi:hypothetical protein
VDEPHRREAVEEAAEGHGVDVDGSVAGEVGRRPQQMLDAADPLAQEEERQPDERGTDREDRTP